MTIYQNFTILLTCAVLFYLFLTACGKNPAAGKKRVYRNVALRGLQTLSEKKSFWLCLVLFFAATRLILFTVIPYGLNQDGVMGAVDAKALADYGTDRFGTYMPSHLYAWGYGQMSSFLSYASVPFIKLFGLNRFTLRFPTLVFSLLGIAAIFGCACRSFDLRTGALAGLLAAISPWQFMQSRWALDCNLFPHIFVIGLYLLVRGLEKRRYAYLSMIPFALCMYCYGVAFYMVPFFLLTASVYLLAKRRLRVRDAALCVLVYFAFAWPEYLTMFLNSKKWPTISLPFVTMQYFDGSVRSNDILFFSEHKLHQLADNFHALINVAFLQKGDLIWNEITGFGSVYRCSIPLILLGLFLTFRRMLQKKAEYALLFFYFLFAFLTGLLINGVNVNRINIIFYSHILLIAVALSYLIEKSKPSAALFGVVYLSLFLLFLHTYFTTWAEKAKDAYYYDFVCALEYTEELNAEKLVITPDTQFDGAYTVTEILTMFVYEIDAAYWRGEAPDKDALPYRERFVYRNTEDGEILDQNTVYLYRSRERESERFREAGFRVREFGDRYGVAVFDFREP